MLKTILILTALTLSFPLFAGTLTNLTSQNRVRILKVLESFEIEIIEEMRKGKIVESCMKIADAYNASIELETLTKKNIYELKGQLLELKTDCANLDLVRLDDLYLNQMSRRLAQAQASFKKI